MNPKVSVIMPSLNVVQYIDQCMESVLTQTLKEIEILCVDAGSDDGTWEHLQAYKKKDGRIRLLHSSVKSYGHQVNLGIGQAKGEYLAIVETDDYIDKNMLEKLYSLAREHKLDYIKAGAMGIHQFKSRTLKSKMEFGNRDSSLMEKIVSLDKYPQILAMDHYIWRGIYRRQFLLEYCIYCSETKGAAYQDIGFTHLVTAYSKRGMFIDEPFYQYRISRVGSSSHGSGGIKYTYYEYHRLIENCRYLEKIPQQSLEYFWRRFIKAILGEVNHVLAVNNYNLSDLFIKPYCIWFQNELRKKIIEDTFLKQNFSEEEQREIEQFAYDYKVYAEMKREKEKQKAQYRQKFISFVEGKQSVIFGSGIYGFAALELLYENNLEIVGFCDNNKTLWGREKYGAKIYSPSYMTEHYPHAVYIVANKTYADVMAEQLKRMNIENIIIYKNL